MGLLYFMIIFGVLMVIVRMAAPSPSAIAARGLPARGILLAVTSVRAGIRGTGKARFERRQVQLDIEIPGQAPYEFSGTVFVPTNLVADVLPGATVELRLGKHARKSIVVVGPGAGFAAASLATQGQLNQGAA